MMVRINCSSRGSDGYRPKDKSSDEPLVLPFAILRAQNEQMPWSFGGMYGDSDVKYRPLIVTVKSVHLKTGDYTIEGMDSMFTIERKSLSDAAGTLAGGRERFEKEHERMQAMLKLGGFAAVIIESTPTEMINNPPSGLTWKTMRRTQVSWQLRYGVPWLWAGSRRDAEVLAFDFITTFWERTTGEKIR